MAGIEILRFFAALSILIWHYQHFFFEGACDIDIAQPMRPGFPFYGMLAMLYNYGHASVQVFWVISGFVFMRRYYEAISQATISFEEFAIRRFSRLYPLHIVTLAAVIVLQHAYLGLHPEQFIYQHDTATNFVAQLFMASNWFAERPLSFNGPVWSVSVELLVYALFYAVLRPIKIEALQSPISRTAIAAMAVALLSYGVKVLTPSVLMCGMFFMCGCFAERICAKPVAVKAWLAALAVAALGLGAAHIIPTGVVILVVAVSATIAAAHLDALVPTGLLGHAARLGNATYSSYLLHFPLQLVAVIFVDSYGLGRDVFREPAVFLGFMGVTIALSLATYHWFEVPAQRWLRAAWRVGSSSRHQAAA